MQHTAIADRPDELHDPESFITKYVWSQDHKVIAIQYGCTAIFVGLIALALVFSDITLGAEPIQTFLHTAFDTGLPVLMTFLASLMLAAMAGFDERDSTSALEADPWLAEIARGATLASQVPKRIGLPVEYLRNMGLSSEVVDLIGLHIMDNARQIRGVGQITIMQAELGIGFMRVLVDVIDTLRIE